MDDDEQPPENYVFETVECYYVIEDMHSTEWDYTAEEYWHGE